MKLIDISGTILIFLVLFPMNLLMLYIMNTNNEFGKKSRNESLSFMSKTKWNILFGILIALLIIDLAKTLFQ